MDIMKPKEEEVKLLYDNFASSLLFMQLDAFFGRSTENSIYRKRAIATLNLNTNSTVLDVACGIGYNFKIIQSYLQNKGKFVALDISPKSLEVANGKIRKNKWTNMELVNKSISDYKPDFSFDAILCTYAMEIIPDYKKAIDTIFNLIKPKGRFAMIGMKLSSKFPFTILNLFFKALYISGGINPYRDPITYIKSKFNKIECYKKCFFGYAYILSAIKC